jgi:hypothetical protein
MQPKLNWIWIDSIKFQFLNSIQIPFDWVHEIQKEKWYAN